MLVGRSVEVKPAAQHVDRRPGDVELLHVGHHQRASAFRRGGAVEQMERVGDGPRCGDVVRPEWTALVVNGFGIARAVVSDGCRDDGQLFAGRAIHMHVPARDERELRGGEHAPRRHELVLRPCPRSRRLVIAVFTGLGGDKDDSLGETVLDGRRRFGDHAQPETEALPGRSETQVVDQRRGQRTRCDAVDGVQLDSRIGQRAPYRFECQAPRRLAVQPSALSCVVDTDDGGGTLPRAQSFSDPAGLQFSSATTPR